MDQIRMKLHQLDKDQLRQLVDTSAEVHRALEELVVQLISLEEDLDISDNVVYTKSSYRPMHIHTRAFMDMVHYKKVAEGFRDLAMGRFETDAT